MESGKKITTAEKIVLICEHYHYKLCEKENINDIHHFREGFKLGVQLMLEVFSTQ